MTSRAICIAVVSLGLAATGASCKVAEPDVAGGVSAHERQFAAIEKAEQEKNGLKRCLNYPAPPEYHWSKDVQRALCMDIHEPVPQAVKVKGLIGRSDWKGLHAYYTGFVERHYSGADPESLLYRAFPVNSWKDEAEALEYSERWLEAAPDDPFANTLRAKVLLRQAWILRGSGYAKDVPDERMREVKRLAREGGRHAAHAIAKEPKLLLAYSILLETTGFTSDKERATELLQKAIEQSPDNFYVREAAFSFLEPKWGGSLEQMDQLIHEAQPHESTNPRLVFLRVYRAAMAGDRFSMQKQYGPALDVYRQALAIGPEDSTLQAAALAADEVGRHAESVMLWSQELRFSRAGVYALVRRGIAWENLDEPVRAIRDYARAAELEPEKANHLYRIASLQHGRQNLDEAEKYYLKTLELDPDHVNALRFACRMWVHLRQEPRKAKPYAERLTRLTPDDPEAWLLLANIHHGLGDPAVYTSAQRFLDLASPDDPEMSDSIGHIRRFLDEHPPSGS
jgi:tetratricopeptide (TPR) repeat protein